MALPDDDTAAAVAPPPGEPDASVAAPLLRILHRFSAALLFEGRFGSLRLALEAAVSAKAYLGGADLGGADLGGADLGGAYLGGAYLGGAYLRGADLGGADLGGAYLRGADLRGADLRGADLDGVKWGEGALWRDGVPVTREPVVVSGLPYPVTILDRHAQIGCHCLTIQEWEALDESAARRIEGQAAVEFWRGHREVLLALAKAAGRPVEPAAAVAQPSQEAA